MSIAGTFVGVGNVYEIDGPGMKITVVDTTHLCSAIMTSRPGRIPDPDVISVKLWFDPNDTAMHGLILDRCQTPGPIDDFMIIFNDDFTTHATAAFSGFFTSFTFNGMKVNENLGADLEIKVTTKVEITVGSGS
jgi:hypothetical protein